ncbi:MAG: LytR family transcriptional regulator [Ruminiclostridium sp.]|nr:LytR family transcriptional regulator [Ruminiclostridium sp.]
MKLRQIILLSCIAFLVVLFANGMYVLSYYGRESRYEKMGTGERSMPGRPQQESSLSENPPVNLLLLGLDEEGVRSDVILLANYDPGHSSLNLLSIARDTRVFARGKYSKINALYSAGKESLLAEEIRQLTGLSVNYYITMNFKGFRKLVDTLDGVMFDIPFDMDYDDPDQNLHIHLNKGIQLLTGKKAEQLVRYRKGNRHNEGYIDGDIGRIKMQQDFIKAMAKQKLNLKYFTRADDIFDIFNRYFGTNINARDFTYYLPSIRNIKSENIHSYTLPGESAMNGEIWYFIADREKTGEMIQSNFYE